MTTAATPKTPLQILLDTKTALLERDWIQGHMFKDEYDNLVNIPQSDLEMSNGCCLYGAYLIASNRRYCNSLYENEYLARYFLRKSIGGRLDCDIVNFNDAAQSKEEVLAILDKAIELAKMEETNNV